MMSYFNFGKTFDYGVGSASLTSSGGGVGAAVVDGEIFDVGLAGGRGASQSLLDESSVDHLQPSRHNVSSNGFGAQQRLQSAPAVRHEGPDLLRHDRRHQGPYNSVGMSPSTSRRLHACGVAASSVGIDAGRRDVAVVDGGTRMERSCGVVAGPGGGVMTGAGVMTEAGVMTRAGDDRPGSPCGPIASFGGTPPTFHDPYDFYRRRGNGTSSNINGNSNHHHQVQVQHDFSHLQPQQPLRQQQQQQQQPQQNHHQQQLRREEDEDDDDEEDDGIDSYDRGVPLLTTASAAATGPVFTSRPYDVLEPTDPRPLVQPVRCSPYADDDVDDDDSRTNPYSFARQRRPGCPSNQAPPAEGCGSYGAASLPPYGRLVVAHHHRHAALKPSLPSQPPSCGSPNGASSSDVSSDMTGHDVMTGQDVICSTNPSMLPAVVPRYPWMSIVGMC